MVEIGILGCFKEYRIIKKFIADYGIDSLNYLRELVLSFFLGYFDFDVDYWGFCFRDFGLVI